MKPRNNIYNYADKREIKYVLFMEHAFNKINKTYKENVRKTHI